MNRSRTARLACDLARSQGAEAAYRLAREGLQTRGLLSAEGEELLKSMERGVHEAATVYLDEIEREGARRG